MASLLCKEKLFPESYQLCETINVKDDLEKLIEVLPFFFQLPLKRRVHQDPLIEIVFDLGRRPEARFRSGTKYLSQKIISWQDLEYLTKRVSKFSTENRAGIERTLHRISCIRNRQFLITGVTCRVGRAIVGGVSVIRDLLQSEKSILILGKPGVGKTTVIREMARVLSDEMEKRVIIIDTSNEIGGDSDVPHFGIGRARRMQVPKAESQHQVMIEAVENHMPQVIIIDEIGTELEVLAARTIAEKGVKLVGTTHGNCLENLVKNPPLADLIGGIQYVTLSDEEAKRRNTQKSILERKAYPAFEIIIEINRPKSWTIHESVQDSVDLLLLNQKDLIQLREFPSTRKVLIKSKPMLSVETVLSNQNPDVDLLESRLFLNWRRWNQKNDSKFSPLPSKWFFIYSYCLPNNLLKEIFFKMDLRFIFTPDIQKASVILGFKNQLHQNWKLVAFAKQKKIPLYILPRISFYQISKFIQFFLS